MHILLVHVLLFPSRRTRNRAESDTDFVDLQSVLRSFRKYLFFDDGSFIVASLSSVGPRHPLHFRIPPTD